MLYIYNNCHSPDAPYPRGWSTYDVNITTGKEIWQIAGTSYWGAPSGISDGYLVMPNGQNGYQYCYGMGLSTTTVTTPDTVVTLGTGVMIKGTVLDESPAQPGTPCVSDASITATSSDGTVINIGTVTTNGYGGTYGITWTPPSAGTYTITASFAGDDSYSSSLATSSLAVGTSASTTVASSTQTPTTSTSSSLATTNDLMTYLAIIAIAIIIAIGIVGALILRKKTIK
jgi:hypothetical protein